jgi:hypothetical protein
MAERKTCDGCGKTYWSPGADWQHASCVPAAVPESKVPAKARKRPAKPVVVGNQVEVPAGFKCPVCEANKARARAKMKAYRKRKKAV